MVGGMWLGKTEAPTMETTLPQLVDIAWRAMSGQQVAGESVQWYQEELEKEKQAYGRLRAEYHDQGLEIMALEQKLTELDFRLLEVEQDRDSWKTAYHVAIEAQAAQAEVRNDGKRPIDPFGKDGINRTGPYDGLGGTIRVTND